VTDEYDEDQPIRINFTDVEPRKAFYLLPAGLNVIVEIEDYEEERASDSAANPGARMINWKFSIESTEDGEEEVTARVRNPEDNKPSVQTIRVVNRKLFHRMVFVEAMYQQVMEFMDACGYATDGEIAIWPNQMVGERLMIRVGVQPGKKNKETGDFYKPRNRCDKFLPVPTVVVEETPAVEKKSKVKAKKEDEVSEATV
jgi:hypothetical protein